MSRANLLENTCSRIIYFANKQLLKDGICIHTPILKLGIQDNLELVNNLLSLYTKCCGSEYARHLFDEMPLRDVVSWTTVLSAYVKDGNHKEALRFFESMKISGEKPNEFTFSNVLRSCSALRDSVSGARVHASVIKHGFGSNTILCSSLTELYSKSDLLEDAVRVFNGVADADTVSWTSMISSFVQAGNGAEAARYYIRMIERAVPPNECTFVKLLSACSSLGVNRVELVHAQLILWGALLNLVLKTALFDAYAKNGKMEYALKVLKQTSEQDVKLWNIVILGFIQNTNLVDAIAAFRHMAGNGIIPSTRCYVGILNACSSNGVLHLGIQMHKQVIVAGLENDISVGNALLDFYVKCSNAVEDDEQGLDIANCALRLVKGMSYRNVATYTILASRLNQIGRHELSLEIINHMRDDDIQIDGFIISTFLSASAILGAVKTGEQLHCYSITSGFGRWISVSNGLIDFYGKCQCMLEAQRVFSEVCEPDTISWNCLMHGFALNGHPVSALSTLEDMRLSGTMPDSITLMMVLDICSKEGLVDMAMEYFHSLRQLYDIKPQLNHYTMLLDLLGRAGRLQEAVGVLKSIPFIPDASIYKRLLNACKLHRNMLLAEELAREALELDPQDLEFYSLLATIYDEAGRSDLGDNMCRLVKDEGLRTPSVSRVRRRTVT